MVSHIAHLAARPDTPTLEENVLTKMVQEKLFVEVKKDGRQTEARKLRGCLLSCLVNIGGPPTKRIITVYEPDISYYSKLGRVLVIKQIEWCCPCAKARQSCFQKCIAKWHLSHATPELFVNVTYTEDTLEELFPTDTEEVGEQQLE